MDLAITVDERRRILHYRRRLGVSNLFELLEIEAEEADKRSIKRAYFRLSKEFHPDRHYGKELGPFADWLPEVFKAVTAAFNTLGDNKKRARYEADLRGDSTAEKPQSREEHAHVLFQDACDAELHGESEQALKLFAASIRMHEKPRVLRRAAMCAVQAQELSVAEEYAKKAAHLCVRDASYWRTLADVYRAGRRLYEANEVLERALDLDTENDVLFSELKSDLASVKASIEELETQ
ncbi:MAG: DnaJ domain-containing protein [Myxococcales bacterium]|nr:DnaJ domain-containing protein [Myxococcales bacterium]